MTTQDDAPAPLPREELVAMVARAHSDSGYGDSTQAGRTLAAQSKLPKVIAENLGAGFGQWDFFPEPADIVDFACAYVPPASEEEVWTLARAWASDDAAGRPTLLALVGREILKYELRRIDVPKLRELCEETRETRANALRAELGLPVPAPKIEAPAKPKRSRAAPAGSTAAGGAPPPKREIPTKMPKPEFVKPAPKAPPPAAKIFHHPKFGDGVLLSQAGEGPDAKLTIKFESGPKTLLARFVTEKPTP